MAQINIDRQNNDMFYRYKIPQLRVEIQKGSKTVLLNLNAVAKWLDRSPADLSKFFRCQLSTQAVIRPKEDRYVFSGVHSDEKLQNYLYDYIDRFVLCPICRNPETKLNGELRIDAKLHQLCTACGHEGTINVISHKLATVRPQSSPERAEELESASIENDDYDDDVDWGDDDLPSSISELNTQMKSSNQFGDLLEKKRQERKLNDAQTLKDIIVESERLEIREKAPFVAAQYLFTDNILKELDDYKVLFNKLCSKNAKSQRYLLNALENFCAERQDIREKIFNKKTMSEVLMKLYDNDIIEEENFYIWHETTGKDIQGMSNDFIQWLRTAEESSDNDENS